jgi:glycerol-3-phosphate acyltransferase PlsY
MVLLTLFGLVIGGFLLGSIPFGYMVVKVFYHQDIRQLGSGNIGMTNVWRTFGWRAGFLVLLLDVLKGFIPVFVGMGVLALHRFVDAIAGPAVSSGEWLEVLGHGDPLSVAAARVGPMAIGLAAILGHTFTPWLNFKGGKGVATGLGVAIALFLPWILIPVSVFVLLLLTTRMVSAASIGAALALAITGFFVEDGIQFLYLVWPFGILALMLVLYTHRSNIRRILNGTENKISFGRKNRAEN